MVKICSECGQKLTWNQSYTIQRKGWREPRLVCFECLKELTPGVAKEIEKDG